MPVQLRNICGDSLLKSDANSRLPELFDGLRKRPSRERQYPDDKINVVKAYLTHHSVRDVPRSDCSLPPELFFTLTSRYFVAKPLGIRVLEDPAMQPGEKLTLPS